ncbi:MAG: hypothetical protein JWO82_2042, partial [Akkermansiaceae bacterium]|nr:hypothetical protein [Akkermansiaceae bacterium]
MKFASPEWFLLIPALLFIGWFWKSLRLWSPLRLLLVGLAAFGLADPKLNMQEESMDLWVLLDRSDSTEDLVDKGLPEWKALLEKNRPNSRTDEIHLLDYATDVIPHEAEGVTMNRKLTRTGLALSHVAALAKEGKPARVLLFTDGYSTEPLQEAAAQLQARGIPLDYRLIRDQVDNDFRMAHLDFPERVQAGEPFLISALVQGSKDGTVNFILRRNGQQIAENKVVLTKGIGRVEFTDRIPRGGGFQYEAEVRTDASDPSMEDSRPGNNKIARWIEITGGPRV